MPEIDVFREVFKDVGFPFFSVDLDRLREKFQAHDEIASGTRFAVTVAPRSARTPALLSSLLGLLGQIEVPPQLTRIFAGSQSLSRNDFSTRLTEITTGTGYFRIEEVGDQLIWEEDGVWPLAYATFLSQFIEIVSLHRAIIETRNLGIPAIQTLSEYPRQLPTHFHYAAASLGAWLGGAINVQYFAYYATVRQIFHSPLNLSYAQRIGYDHHSAQKLDSSGMIALPASLVVPLLEAQGNREVFGSIGMNEANVANPPNVAPYAEEAPEQSRLPGFIADKYYRATFTARAFGAQALYGGSDVLRDHYTEFYQGLKDVSLIRCKHFCVPVVEVEHLDEIREQVARIPDHGMGGVFFRGQRKLYSLRREKDIQRMLFGDSCGDEPSLVTAASREAGYDYDTAHFALKYFIADALHESPVAVREHWREASSSSTCEIDSAILALAQHYGLPSHGLDITNSDDVALWFATNVYQKMPNGLATYTKMSADQWPSDPADWPVILACQCVTHSIKDSLHDCGELAEFGFAAARPTAQQGRFFQGGHSDHQNRLAEAVVCVFRLRPNEYPTESTFDALFPAPSDDPAYRLMLDFASHPAFAPVWGRFINRFHA